MKDVPSKVTAEGLDWFAGMADSCVASLRAAAEGRAAMEKYESEAEYDLQMFTEADHSALSGEWSWFSDVVGPAVEAGAGGLMDDDLSYVALWVFDPADIVVPALFLHGAAGIGSFPAHTGSGSRDAAQRA